jgi:hypothetical protein
MIMPNVNELMSEIIVNYCECTINSQRVSTCVISQKDHDCSHLHIKMFLTQHFIG